MAGDERPNVVLISPYRRAKQTGVLAHGREPHLRHTCPFRRLNQSHDSRVVESSGLTHDNYLRPRLNALAGRWLVIMEPRRINAFADVNLDDGLKLAIARDLKRVWSEVLEQPLPTELRRLIDRLEQATRGQSLGPE